MRNFNWLYFIIFCIRKDKRVQYRLIILTDGLMNFLGYKSIKINYNSNNNFMFSLLCPQTPGLYHMPPELMLHNSASMQYLQMHPMGHSTTIAQMQAAHQASIMHQNLHQGNVHQANIHQAQLHQQSLSRPCQHHAPRINYRTP